MPHETRLDIERKVRELAGAVALPGDGAHDGVVGAECWWGNEELDAR